MSGHSHSNSGFYAVNMPNGQSAQNVQYNVGPDSMKSYNTLPQGTNIEVESSHMQSHGTNTQMSRNPNERDSKTI